MTTTGPHTHADPGVHSPVPDGDAPVGDAGGGSAPAGALDIDVLERSFDLIEPHAEQVVAWFYASLFDRAPQLEELFGDLAEQRQSLIATLVVLRRSLRDLPSIVPALRSLGARHVRYGAVPEHYPLVAELLIAAMARAGDQQWRSEYTTEWEKALTVVAGEMLTGAASADGADKPRRRAAAPR
jgi:hemoglobin-like flavoprotein